MAAGNGAEGPFVLAVPSKGRLQEAAHAFFARAGLELVQGRGARDYRGAIAGLPGVEVAYVSSAEIVGQLAAGAAHFGVAGEDLLREKIPDVEARLELLSPLGFGHANVVVAAPKAWIDVRTMADLDDVASAYRAKRGERMRVATKYVNLTRRFFADRGRARFRRSGAHRRHHHHRRDARSQWAQDPGRRNHPALAGDADRLAHRALGGECETSRPRHPRSHCRERGSAAVARSPGAPSASSACRCRDGRRADVDPHGFVALHCARGKVAELAGWLLTQGAERVSVAALEQTFAARNALYESLEKRIGAGER
jgi:ATP phosphoribosyltransferase